MELCRNCPVITVMSISTSLVVMSSWSSMAVLSLVPRCHQENIILVAGPTIDGWEYPEGMLADKVVEKWPTKMER